MDPVTVIVTALSLGAQTALKATVETAVKDAYAGLKSLVLRKLGKQPDAAAAVEAVEKHPELRRPQGDPRRGADHRRRPPRPRGRRQGHRPPQAPGDQVPRRHGGLVDQINAAGGKVLVLSGGNQGTINM